MVVVVVFRIYVEFVIWRKIFFFELFYLIWDVCNFFFLNVVGIIYVVFEEGCERN